MPEWNVPGYRPLRALGSGGFGDVILARHDASGVLVAIKYLRSDVLADTAFTRMFRGEAAALASLDDPNVVRLYEYVESPSGAAIVMELIEGVTLREILTHHGQTTPEAALVVLRDSLMGLAAGHRRGAVHGGYKPENVLVKGDGVIKLADFGLAARTADHVLPAGTSAYAAPEQIAGALASPPGDVYAATATFYECLTGYTPFSGESGELRQHRAEPVRLGGVPAPLRPLVAAGMAKDPARRPAEATAFVAELQTVASAAYGKGWADRGRPHLGQAALLLAALWPSGASPAPHAATERRISLLRRIGPTKAAIAAGVAATVIATGAALATTNAPQTRPPRRPAPVVHPISLQPTSLTPTTPVPVTPVPASPVPASPGPTTPVPASPGPTTPVPPSPGPTTPVPPTLVPTTPPTPPTSPTSASNPSVPQTSQITSVRGRLPAG
jgi:eukaryotic-like serine/threonine-protein kinase